MTVEDNGIGISDEDQRNLFTLFGTVKRVKEDRNKHGCGLGLTVCKKLA